MIVINHRGRVHVPPAQESSSSTSTARVLSGWMAGFDRREQIGLRCESGDQV